MSDDVKDAFVAALKEHFGEVPYSHKVHTEHHAFLDSFKKKWEKIEGIILGALVMAVLAAAAFAFVAGVHK